MFSQWMDGMPDSGRNVISSGKNINININTIVILQFMTTINDSVVKSLFGLMRYLFNTVHHMTD
jgi:hypothetical protein